ncbi:hypothetical protein OF829_03485 [Sphingomonas sp. LB-2]|uniref:hypothetical protein n=1 Tax=Sphingomonas caeni TaxID=2984949 RepID=UPI002230DC82|nr:hypothetical protein [Sphingomonas caeni]MCW3846288.1 hypothetical protein [Sphingomonas caeni]
MRGILVLLGLLVLAAVVLISLGMLKIDWKAGQMPSFEFKMDGGKLPTVQTGTVETGTTNVTVVTPTVEMKNTVVTLPTVEVKPAPGATPAAKK